MIIKENVILKDKWWEKDQVKAGLGKLKEKDKVEEPPKQRPRTRSGAPRRNSRFNKRNLEIFGTWRMR